MAHFFLPIALLDIVFCTDLVADNFFKTVNTNLAHPVYKKTFLLLTGLLFGFFFKYTKRKVINSSILFFFFFLIVPVYKSILELLNTQRSGVGWKWNWHFYQLMKPKFRLTFLSYLSSIPLFYNHFMERIKRISLFAKRDLFPF